MYLREERKINLGNLERERTIRGGSRGELQAAPVLKELKLSHHLNKYYLLTLPYDRGNKGAGGEERKRSPGLCSAARLKEARSHPSFLLLLLLLLPPHFSQCENSTFAGAVTNDESFRRYVTSASRPRCPFTRPFSRSPLE